jgi:hypothetical protein
MATSPSDPGLASVPVPPEVIAIAIALATTMLEPDTDHAPLPPDDRAWRWQAWDHPER